MEPSLQRKISPSQPAIPPFFPEQGLLAASAGSAQTDRRKRAVEAKSPNFIGEASSANDGCMLSQARAVRFRERADYMALPEP